MRNCVRDAKPLYSFIESAADGENIFRSKLAIAFFELELSLAAGLGLKISRSVFILDF